MSEQHSPTPGSDPVNRSPSNAPSESGTPRFRAFEPEAQPPASFRVESSGASDYTPQTPAPRPETFAARPTGSFSSSNQPNRSFSDLPGGEPTSHKDRFAFGDEPHKIKDEPSPFQFDSSKFKSQPPTPKPEKNALRDELDAIKSSAPKFTDEPSYFKSSNPEPQGEPSYFKSSNPEPQGEPTYFKSSDPEPQGEPTYFKSSNPEPREEPTYFNRSDEFRNEPSSFKSEPPRSTPEPIAFMDEPSGFDSERAEFGREPGFQSEPPKYGVDPAAFKGESSDYRPRPNEPVNQAPKYCPDPAACRGEAKDYRPQPTEFRAEPTAPRTAPEFRAQPEPEYDPTPKPRQTAPTPPAPEPAAPAPKVAPTIAIPKPSAPKPASKPAAHPVAAGANPYAIKRPEYPAQGARPDQIQAPKMLKRRKQYLPTMYGLWWMATLVFFLLVTALGSFHALEYWGYDPLTIRWEDMQDKFVFISFAGSMLATLFLIWVLQNTAKGLTNSKPNPETAYNNVYGVMLCLLIIGSLKLASDVMSRTTDSRSGGQLAWLREHAFGPSTAAAEEPPVTRTTDPKPDSPADPAPETKGTQTASPTTTTTSTTKPGSTTGRNLPQAKPQPTPRLSTKPSTTPTTEIRVGDPSQAVMAESMRAFQSAAGKARTADRVVMTTPQPDLRTLTSAAPIEAVANAHLEAFEAHLELARIAATLPDTAKVRMLEAGATVERTEEQVASLRSLLSLDSAVKVQNAEAGVHGAQAAYAGFLAQHFGEWKVVNGSVTFEDAELGKTAVDLQSAIGQRETELKAAKFDSVGG